MSILTDNELIEELRKRFELNRKALYDLRVMTGKLEDMNKKLVESEAMKSHFISNIKNEINNPLTSVLLLSKELAYEDAPDPAQVACITQTIYREIFSLDFQLRNIFAAAEIEAGEAVPSISNVDVDMLIQSSLDSLKHKSEEKSLVVKYTFIDKNEGVELFKTDSEKLQLIILNLLGNAIEYTPAGSLIELKVWRHDGHLNLLVADSGTGLNEEEQKVIFDRFRQLDSGVSKNYSGHGLGLSVVKAMVEMLNGTISVTSRKGYGCIFTVFIPQAKSDSVVDVFSDDGNEFFFEEEEGEKF